MAVLPLKFVDPMDPRRSVTFSKGHSIHSNEDFLDCIVGRISECGAGLYGTTTIEASLMKMRERPLFGASNHVYQEGHDGSFSVNFTYNKHVPNNIATIFATESTRGMCKDYVKEWMYCVKSLENAVAWTRSLMFRTRVGVQHWGAIAICTPNISEEMEMQFSYYRRLPVSNFVDDDDSDDEYASGTQSSSEESDRVEGYDSIHDRSEDEPENVGLTL